MLRPELAVLIFSLTMPDKACPFVKRQHLPLCKERRGVLDQGQGCRRFLVTVSPHESGVSTKSSVSPMLPHHYIHITISIVRALMSLVLLPGHYHY